MSLWLLLFTNSEHAGADFTVTDYAETDHKDTDYADTDQNALMEDASLPMCFTGG